MKVYLLMYSLFPGCAMSVNHYHIDSVIPVSLQTESAVG